MLPAAGLRGSRPLPRAAGLQPLRAFPQAALGRNFLGFGGFGSGTSTGLLLRVLQRCLQLSPDERPRRKLGQKLEQAVFALLSSQNDEEAAKSIGVSVETVQRWRKKPEFDQALRDARMAAFRQSMARLQQASLPAVTTLLKLMVEPGSVLNL